MRRSTLGWAVAVVAVLGALGFAWLWFAGGSGEPSTDLTTPTIADGSAPTTGTGTETGTEADGPTTTGADGPTTTGAAAGATFVIDSTRSTAYFEIGEELRGSPVVVRGSTDQVAGRIELDVADLSAARLSQVVINARTFKTDEERRDRAIRGPIILNSASDEHELITFDVTSIDGLEGAAAPGDTVMFTVTGDLTIRGAVNTATFDVEATLSSDGAVSGTAVATVLRSDFGIGVPSVPGVANVSDEVALVLELIAVGA